MTYVVNPSERYTNKTNQVDRQPLNERATYVGDRNSFAGIAQILEHVLDQDRALRDLAFCCVVNNPPAVSKRLKWDRELGQRADSNGATRARGDARENNIPIVIGTPSELFKVILVVAVDIVKDQVDDAVVFDWCVRCR